MSNSNTEQSYQEIINRLHALRRQWRVLLFSHSLLRWLGALALALTPALIIDQILPLPRFLRMGLVLVWLGVGVYAAFRYLIRPVFQKLTTARVAAYVEDYYPGFENRILSTVQLKPEMENNRFGYALEFIEKLIEGTHQLIAEIESRKVFSQEFLKLKRYGSFALVAFALLFITLFIFPSAAKDFAQAFDELPKTPQDILVVQIDEIQPGSVLIESEADVTITAKVTGHFGAPVHLYYRVGSGGETMTSASAQRNVLMTRNETEIAYRFTFKNVTQSMEYYIAVKGEKSEHFHITVARAPILSRFQLKLSYPKYTELSPQILEENLGDVTTLIGTMTNFEGEGNKSIASARLVFEESDPVKLTVTEGIRLSGSFIVQRSEKYHIELIDTDSVSNAQPIVYTLHAIEDTAPQIEIVAPGKDVVLDDSMIVSLQLDAKDDYGVQKIQLIYRVEGTDDDVAVPLKKWDPTDTPVFIEFPWDIDPMGLYPGDVISYHAEAFDADNVSGPNIGKSNIYSIRFPTLAELYNEVEFEQEVGMQGIEALYDDQAEQTAITDELLDKIRKSQELTLKDKKLMEQVLKNQEEIDKTAKDLFEEMKRTTEQMQKQQLFDMQTVEKFQELQELMQQALSEEHKELLRKLAEALEHQELSEQEQKLMEANFNQERFLQQLDRLKDLYKQMIIQQKLEAAVNQTKELAERQERVMDQLSNLAEQVRQNSQSNPQDVDQRLNGLANQEERIAEEMNNLHQTLEELGEEMLELENLKRVGDEIKRLNQFARDVQIAQDLRSATQQMRGEQMQGAMESGAAAQQGLTELHQGLDNALEFMEGGNAEETLTAIREAVRGGLYISRTHEEVIDRTNEILGSGHGRYLPGEVKQLQGLAASELGLASGLNLLADRLWELGSNQMQIDPKTVWRLSAAANAFERSARALEDRKPNLAVPIQQQGLADLNQAVADLLEAMDQMNQQMGEAGMQNMLEQLEQLAQSQGQLNEMAQQLNQQMRQQGRTPSNEQLLRRLAYEQQMIREATERVADMMERMSEVLGDLNNISEEMKEVEGELQQGNLNQQVLDKQREILTRMLESSKSLQKREVSKRRKSEVAKTPTATGDDAPPLDPKLIETIQQIESNLRSGEQENLPPQYRELIQQYFKALSEQTQKKLSTNPPFGSSLENQLR